MNKSALVLLFIAFLYFSTKSRSQCVVTGSTSIDTVLCGSCATLSAYGQGQGQNIFSENFNTGGYGPGWQASQQAMWNNPCSSGGVDGTTHIWMGNSSPVPRILATQSYNLTAGIAGVTMCFDMLFATQGNTAPCEGPDEPQEGVYLQYSIDGGVTWITFHYFDPNGGSDPQLTNWNNWCFSLPAAAITSNTQIRWYQDADSGADYDHWGIDNVNIFFNDPTYVITYLHDGCNLGASGGTDPTPVCPHVTTQYTVQMTNGTSTCTDIVTVNVKMPTIIANAGTDLTVCPGQCTQLTGEAIVIVSPAKTPTYENNQITAVTGGNASVNINVTGLNMPSILPNSITQVCINGFTFSGTQLCTNFSGCNCNGTPIAFGASCNLDISSFNVLLHSPSGCQITLVPQYEATGTSYTDVCFVPSGGQNIAAPNFPAAGSWNPSQPFSTFDGCTSNGVWSIEFDAPGGVGFGLGTFTGWNISFDDPEISYQGNFNWSPTTNMTNSTTLTPTVCPIANTTYTISVSDTAGCASATDNVNVNVQNCCNFVVTATITQPQCGLTNGVINVTVTPASTYTYAWSNGATTQNITGLGSGTYTVTITDAVNSCNSDTTFTLSNPSAPTVTMSSTNALCGDTNGTATATATGGVAPLTYAWSNGGSSANITGLGAGSFSVTVSGSNGCTATGSVSITSPAAPTSTVTVTDALCGSSNGSATVTVSGGASPYFYSWSGGQTSATINNLAAGSYNVTITDNANCTITDVASVSSLGGPSVSVSVTNAPCAGNIGAASATVTGGNPPYQFLWSNAAITQTISNLSGGIYTVSVTDNNNCLATATSSVVASNSLTITATVANITCSSSDAIANIVGGTAPFSVLWSNGQTSTTVTGLTNGSYSVTVTDQNNCTGTANVTLTVPPAVNAVVSNVSDYNGYGIKCYGGTDGFIDVSVTGGALPLAYLWSNGDTTQDLANLTLGTFSLTVSDANNCTANISVTLTEPVQIVATVIGTDVTCYGAYTGSVDLTINGGSLPYQYSWSNFQTSQDLAYVTAGNYLCNVSDANGCNVQVSVLISQPAQLQLSAIQNISVCKNQIFTVAANVAGGTFPYIYYWDNIPGPQSVSLALTQSVTISVYVKDANNCISNSVLVTITISPDINFDIYLMSDTICEGASANIFGTVTGGDGGPYYVYDNLNQLISFPYEVYPQQNMTYIFTAKDNCGNAKQDSVNIRIIPKPGIVINSDKIKGCIPLSIAFSYPFNMPGATFLWNFGEYQEIATSQNPTHTYSANGDYDVTLTVTSASGCSNTLTYNQMISAYPLPYANFTYAPENASILNPFVEFINHSDGAVYYYWSFGDGDSSNIESPVHLYPHIGSYRVKLVAGTIHDCLDTSIAVIIVHDELTFYAPTAFSPDMNSINDVFKVYCHGLDNSSFQLLVFDRWGEQIFVSKDINTGWDGTYQNKKAQTGAYVWYVNYKDFQGVGHQVSGHVTLLK